MKVTIAHRTEGFEHRVFEGDPGLMSPALKTFFDVVIKHMKPEDPRDPHVRYEIFVDVSR